MKLIIFACFLICFFNTKTAKAIKLDINIYNKYENKEVTFTVSSGKYVIISNEKKIKEIQKGQKINIKSIGDSFSITINNQKIGVYKEVTISGENFVNFFSISNANKIPKRFYDDDFKVKSNNGLLQLINAVDLEKYVAGVVEAESGGSSNDIQFFFVQAISCRTYALVNYLKHSVDGYNLCDEVHCQYYLGKATNIDIIRAVAHTSGDVIVDSNYIMISAAFSSNCGGETVNSEDVWSFPASYLKSVKDTFCLQMSKATWQKVMSKDEFVSKLDKEFNFPIKDTAMLNQALNFKQPTRKVMFVNNIPLKLIRSKFDLRSTFFDINTENNTVTFYGRGFGHGIGLCQQGAIRMIELGYDYKTAIQFYYKNTHIVNYSQLKYKFIP